MNTAPAGRLERKLYHSWTSGSVAAEFAKRLRFLAGEAVSTEWQLEVVKVHTDTGAHTGLRTQSLEGSKTGRAWNEASCRA